MAANIMLNRLIGHLHLKRRRLRLVDFEKNDARNVCNGKSVPATVIYYTSEPGFIGTDSAEFERIGVRGAYGYHIYTINVR